MLGWKEGERDICWKQLCSLCWRCQLFLTHTSGFCMEVRFRHWIKNKTRELWLFISQFWLFVLAIERDRSCLKLRTIKKLTMTCLKSVRAVPPPASCPAVMVLSNRKCKTQKWRIMSHFYVYSKIIFGRNIHLVQYIVHLVQIEQSTAKPYTESGFLWCEKVRVVRYKLAILRYKLIASLYFGIASLYLGNCEFISQNFEFISQNCEFV